MYYSLKLTDVIILSMKLSMKNFLFLSVLFLGLGLTSCKDDEMVHDHEEDHDYNVTVTIDEPTADAMVVMGNPMSIAVKMVHDDNKTIHMVKIEVRDADGNSVEVLDEGHKHEESGTYTFTGEFTPTAHGMYTLYAETSNDAGEKTKSASSMFTVMHEMSDEYPVTVTIVSPEAGSTLAVDEAVHVHITMVHDHGETVHNAKVEVKNADGEVIMTMLDDHVHQEDGNYEFHSMDFVPSAAGTYQVHAETTNHDGAMAQHAHAMFTVE